MIHPAPNSRRPRWSRIILFAILTVSLGWSQQRESLTTVILVRHGEKDSIGVDPKLTERGLERARALDRILSNVDISALYVTQYARTQQTAEMVALRHHLKPTVSDADLSHPKHIADLLVKNILEQHTGQTILVVNHSNVIPYMLKALGADPTELQGNITYDELFIVTRNTHGATRLLVLRYGNPSP